MKNTLKKNKNFSDVLATKNLIKYFLPGGNVLININIHNFDKKTVSRLSAIKIISNFFTPINALASKPIFSVVSDKIILYVFYYIPAAGDRKLALNNNSVNNLGEALSSSLGQPVELRLIKLNYPYLNSYILAQYIALNTQDYNFVQIVRRLFGSVIPIKNTSIAIDITLLPAHILGIKVRVSGRLITERSRPRQTVQTAQIGSCNKDNLSLVDTASFTSKNKKGAFTVKVWISQRAVTS